MLRILRDSMQKTKNLSPATLREERPITPIIRIRFIPSAGKRCAFTGTCCLRITGALYHIFSRLSRAFSKKSLRFARKKQKIGRKTGFYRPISRIRTVLILYYHIWGDFSEFVRLRAGVFPSAIPALRE